MASSNKVAPAAVIATTHEGAPARRIHAEAELRRTIMACLLWEDSFYESGVELADRIATLVPQIDPVQVGMLAVEARTKMHLRHVPLWLLVHLLRGDARARAVAGAVIPKVVQRADELTELLALYWKDGKAPLARQLKVGLREAFQKFDEYQLAKYDRAREVRLRDVLFLTHPTPKDPEQAAVWKRLANNELATPDTWEVALSAGGDRKESWTRLLVERKLGALALLRNLRNMTQAGVDRQLVVDALREAKVDQVLPFRFVAAARHAPEFEVELEQAMFRALERTEKLVGRTILLIDTSGSMDSPLSARSDLNRIDAAAALAVLVREICESVQVICFSTSPTLIPARRGMALVDAVQRNYRGGTNTESAKQMADRMGYDRLILITDEQSHQAISAPKGIGYCVNVAGYQRGIGYGPWTHIDGWSEAVVQYIREAERQ